MHSRSRHLARALIAATAALLLPTQAVVPAVSAAAGVAASSAVVTGTVTSSVDGSPVPGALVTLVREGDNSASSGRSVTATSAGRYSFSVTGPGSYRIRFASPTTILHWYGGGESFDSGALVPVGATGTVEASVSLKPAGTIRGTYTGSAPSGVEVWPRAFRQVSSTIGDGAFTVRVPTESPVAVGLLWADLRVARYNGNKFHRTNSPTLQVGSGEELTGVAIDEPPVATVTGRTTNERGTPMRAHVRATLIEDGQRVDLTTFVAAYSEPATGEYSLLVPATTVTLHATNLGDSYRTGWLGGSQDAPGAQVIEPADGQSFAVDDIALPGGRTVSGTVNDLAGDPIAGVTVTAFLAGTDLVKATAVTGDDGSWSMTALGRDAMPTLKLRYDHPLLTTSWYRNATSEATAVTVWDHLDGGGPSSVAQTMSYLPEHQLVASGSPRILGTAMIGMTVQAESTSVSPAPTSTRFEWFCNSVSLGVTTESLPLRPRHAECALAVRQTSTKPDHGPAIVESAAVAVSAPQATRPITIAGSRVSGALLRAVVPPWNFAPDRFSYQWYRRGNAISGATAATYRLGPADAGDKMSVRVTARSSSTGLMASALSPSTASVKSRTVLRAAGIGNRETLSALLKIRILTPGVAGPGGLITVTRPGYRNKYRVNGTEITHKIGASRRGWITVRVDYSGSSRATPASTSVRVLVE